jgi:hypothetical protein
MKQAKEIAYFHSNLIIQAKILFDKNKVLFATSKTAMSKSGFLGSFWPPDLRHLMSIFWDETWFMSSLGQNLGPIFSLAVSISGATCRDAGSQTVAPRF